MGAQYDMFTQYELLGGKALVYQCNDDVFMTSGQRAIND